MGATFDVVVVGAGTSRVGGRTGTRSSGQTGRPGRARSFPRRQKHVRRGCLRAGARRPHPPVVGRGARAALGHPEGHHGPDQHAVADHRLSGRRLGPAAVQRVHHAAPRLRCVAGGQGHRRGGRARRLHRGHVTPAGQLGARRRCQHRPPRRRDPRADRDRLRRRQLVPGQGGRALPALDAAHLTLGRQRGPGPAPPTRSTSASGWAPTRALDIEISGAPVASRAAASSTPTGHRQRWASSSR